MPPTLLTWFDGSSPRVWGKCHFFTRAADPSGGSSPRVWGKFLNNVANLCNDRFIPTRVGKIGTFQLLISFPSGSSPRVWGKCASAGVIETGSNGSSPRVWGKFLDQRRDQRNNGGSSPRVWGKFISARPRFRCDRFIPTRVGKIAVDDPSAVADRGSSPRVWGKLQPVAFQKATSSVHPHACGENLKLLSCHIA